MMPQYCLMLVTLWFLSGASAKAAWNEACSNVLVKDVTFSTYSNDDKMRIALDINENVFDQMSQHASADATVPIYDVPVKFSGGWDQAKSHQDALREHYKLETDQSSSGLYASSKVQQAAFDSYRACIARNAVGLNIVLEKVEGDAIKVHVLFNTAVGDETKRSVVMHTSDNATMVSGPVDLPIAGNSVDNDWSFRRTGRGVVIVSADLKIDGAVKQTVALDPIPETPTLLHRKEHPVPVVGPQIGINAGYHQDLKDICVPRKTQDGRLENFRLVNDVQKTETAARGSIWIENLPVRNEGIRICQSYGCIGIPGVANCSAVIHGTADEWVLDGWEPIQ